MNCCDEYGNCRQGRDCPVRRSKHPPLPPAPKLLPWWRGTWVEVALAVCNTLAIAALVAVALKF